MKEITLNVNCFNLKATLECGQCFRWKKIEEQEYIGVVADRVLKIRQEDNNIYVSSNQEKNLETVVKNYFDLEKDYKKIEKEIVKIDPYIKEAVFYSSGLRHLNQPFFECLLSYIISANNNIPRISKSVQAIAREYGKKVKFEGEDYYLFPTVEELADVCVEKYRELGVGFRDRYLQATIQSIKNHEFNVDCVDKLSTEELRKELMKLKGIGRKVADCIMLFSCGREEVFPVDVWVEKVMTNLYFKNETETISKKRMFQYADIHFGRNAGIIQQHLFYYMREKSHIKDSKMQIKKDLLYG